MTTNVSAIFEHGKFIPESPCDIPEGARVHLAVELTASAEETRPGAFSVGSGAGSDSADPGILEPEVRDPEERSAILAALLHSMGEHPLPLDAPRFTREQLHERG